MIFKTEEELKKHLSLYGAPRVTLLCGNEPALVVSYRQKLLELLCENGEVERFDGKKLDVTALSDSALLLPMFGKTRVLCVEDLDPAALSERDAEALAALLADFPFDSAIVLSIANGVYEPPKKNSTSLDAKKSSAAKAIFAAAEKAGAVACLDRKTKASLKTALRALCKKGGCELSPGDAELLVTLCGEDFGVLQNECVKLCTLAGKGNPITEKEILRICPRAPETDLYEVARRMLRGDASGTMRLIADLLSQKTPAALILSTLGSAFCDLDRATAARGAGKSAEELAKELHFRFEWRAKNAFRDSARCDRLAISRVCAILCEAETSLKSVSVDERVLLDTAVLHCMAVLKGADVC